MTGEISAFSSVNRVQINGSVLRSLPRRSVTTSYEPVPSRNEPTADFDATVAHELEISASLDGRTVFQPKPKQGHCGSRRSAGVNKKSWKGKDSPPQMRRGTYVPN